MVAKLILFDVDGTLLLTGGAGQRALNRAFERAFQVTDAFAGVSMPGRTDQRIIADALDRAGLARDDPRLVGFRELYCECLSVEIQRPAAHKRVMPGVPELLETLVEHDGLHIGLLTGNFREAARIKLEHFGLWHYFGCGAFGDDAAERNALVPIARQRARDCGWPAFAPEDVFVVGDTPLDVACARAAGARAVAVATGSFDVAALGTARAEAVFENLNDRARFLEVLGCPQRHRDVAPNRRKPDA